MKVKRVEYFVDVLDDSRKEVKVETDKTEDRDTKAAGPCVSKGGIYTNILELLGQEEVREVGQEMNEKKKKNTKFQIQRRKRRRDFLGKNGGKKRGAIVYTLPPTL